MRKVTKKMMVLGFIADSPNGRSFGDIQRFICELNGKNYDEFEYDKDWRHQPTPVDVVDGEYSFKRVGPWKMFRRRKYRGYWCTNLVGSHYGPTGILTLNCKKVDGRYFIKDKSA